jgi:hypothetical protein
MHGMCLSSLLCGGRVPAVRPHSRAVGFKRQLTVRQPYPISSDLALASPPPHNPLVHAHHSLPQPACLP